MHDSSNFIHRNQNVECATYVELEICSSIIHLSKNFAYSKANSHYQIVLENYTALFKSKIAYLPARHLIFYLIFQAKNKKWYQKKRNWKWAK